MSLCREEDQPAENFQKATGSLGVRFDIVLKLLLVGLQKAVDLLVLRVEYVASVLPHYLKDLLQ